MLANEVFNNIKNLLIKADKDISYISFRQNKTDYSIKFFNNVVIKIKAGKKDYFYIKSELENLPNEYTAEIVKSMPGFVRFELNTNCDFHNLSDILNNLYDKSITAQETFGCCNSFILCSDKLKCVNKDKILALGCMYRQNLEQGKIFYGKNKNT